MPKIKKSIIQKFVEWGPTIQSFPNFKVSQILSEGGKKIVDIFHFWGQLFY